MQVCNRGVTNYHKTQSASDIYINKMLSNILGEWNGVDVVTFAIKAAWWKINQYNNC